MTRCLITGIIAAGLSSWSTPLRPSGHLPCADRRGARRHRVVAAASPRVPLHTLPRADVRACGCGSPRLSLRRHGHLASAERIFDSLVQAGLDTAVSTADGVAMAVMTLHASVWFVHEQWTLFADDLIPLQCGYTEVDMAPLLFPLSLAPAGGKPPARRWLAGIELAMMRCPRYTLSPFADLAGFCGIRAPLEARLADTRNDACYIKKDRLR